MEIQYRKAEPADAEALLAYYKQIGGESHNLTFGEKGIPLTAEQEAKILEDISESPTDVVLLALDGEKIVASGSINAYTRVRMSHRSSVAVSVLKAYWGRGIGSEMLERLIEAAKASGAKVVELQVLSENERAKALYRKFGFEYFGTFKKFFCIDGEYFDADYMNLYLE